MDPKYKSPFYDALDKARRQGMFTTKEQEARNWFRLEADKVSVGDDPLPLLQRERQFTRRQILPGFMYQYKYDPKHKNDLPFYDTYPLVFPFSMHSDGFTGINLHYLPRPLRARLMDALYSLTTNKKYNDNQRLNLSYNILKSSAKYDAFKPCVHRYLTSHIRSRYYKIGAEFWDLALFLPTERFQKKSANYVWADSIKKMSKN